MTAADEPFVYRAWLEGYWLNSGAALILSKHVRYSDPSKPTHTEQIIDKLRKAIGE